MESQSSYQKLEAVISKYPPNLDSFLLFLGEVRVQSDSNLPDPSSYNSAHPKSRSIQHCENYLLLDVGLSPDSSAL